MNKWYVIRDDNVHVQIPPTIQSLAFFFKHQQDQELILFLCDTVNVTRIYTLSTSVQANYSPNGRLRAAEQEVIEIVSCRRWIIRYIVIIMNVPSVVCKPQSHKMMLSDERN